MNKELFLNFFNHPETAFAFFGPVFVLIIVWSLLWKGLALWHSAQRGQKWWFIVFLVLNTIGIVEIIYLFAVAKLSFSTLFSSKETKKEIGE